VLGRINGGDLKAIKNGGPTSPWKIFCSEYVRLGFVKNLDELIEHDPVVPASNCPAAGS
jgi:hypothetical protein